MKFKKLLTLIVDNNVDKANFSYPKTIGRLSEDGIVYFIYTFIDELSTC